MPVQTLAERVDALMPRARQDLAELVAIPSVADPDVVPPAACRTAAEWVGAAFAEAGLRDVHLDETPDGWYAVVGHRPPPVPGAPTVLLYCHYDVQPVPDPDAWDTPPWTLTERDDGRWYGRGAADCKGNLVMHLTALRALGDELPVGVKLLVDGAEEQPTDGMARYVPGHAADLHADAVVVADTGNAAVGVPTLTTALRGVVELVVTVSTLSGELHSGTYGGPAPDALAALIRMLDSLRDPDGATRLDALPGGGTWPGAPYDEACFRADAGVLDGVGLVSSGTVADQLWARPAVTVLGIDCPPVAGSVNAVPATARARVGLRIPPGTDPAAALAALRSHLAAAAPWNARVSFTDESVSAPWAAPSPNGGRAFEALRAALSDAYDGAAVAVRGDGGSIPLCAVLASTFPRAELLLLGVEEPACRNHAPNESVSPSELRRMSLAEALFLQRLS